MTVDFQYVTVGGDSGGQTAVVRVRHSEAVAGGGHEHVLMTTRQPTKETALVMNRVTSTGP